MFTIRTRPHFPWVAAVGYAVVAIGFPAPGYTAPILFTYTGTGSGTINAAPFTDAYFTILAEADTNNREALPSGFQLVHDWASISISGEGAFDFITPTKTFVNYSNGGCVGFSRAACPDLYDSDINPAFADWEMLSSVGPVTSCFYLMQWAPSNDPVLVDGGTLVFNDSACCTATFHASVPEPSALIIAIVAVLAFPFLRAFLDNRV